VETCDRNRSSALFILVEVLLRGTGSWLCLLLACGGAGAGPRNDGFGSGTSGPSPGASETGGSGITSSGTDAGDAESSSSGGATPGEVELARGDIRIAAVTLNQGVELAISQNGAWLGPQDRSLRILSGRRAMIRGFVEVPEDWRPRALRGVLTLQHADGTVTTQRDDIEVAADSRPGDLSSTFTFGLEAEQMTPGLTYQLELRELEDAADVAASSTPPVDPPQPELVGVESTPMKMRVVIVPVRYSGGNCIDSTSADELADPAVVQSFEDALFVQNPVQDVELTVHPQEIDFTDYQPGEGFARLLSVMQGMRVADAAPPDVHYYALLDRGGAGSHDGAGGDGYLGGSSIDTASQRVSAGLWCPSCGDGWSAYTFTHEVGHSQGMNHVGCGTSGHQPHPEGQIGAWGFDVLNVELHHPSSTYEYMSYCSPTWMSDWTWAYTWEIIETLTSWEASSVAPAAGKGSVFGLLLPDGREIWTPQPGRIESAHLSASDVIDYLDPGGEVVATMRASVGTFDDGKTRYVNAELPDAPWSTARLRHGDAVVRALPITSLSMRR
jgi:hypothetical protein